MIGNATCAEIWPFVYYPLHLYIYFDILNMQVLEKWNLQHVFCVAKVLIQLWKITAPVLEDGQKHWAFIWHKSYIKERGFMNNLLTILLWVRKNIEKNGRVIEMFETYVSTVGQLLQGYDGGEWWSETFGIGATVMEIRKLVFEPLPDFGIKQKQNNPFKPYI